MKETTQQSSMKQSQRLQMLIVLLLNYFTFALVTNIPGSLFPFWKEDFNLSDTVIRFLGFAFFLAYGLTSLPQGILVDKIGSKKTFVWGASLLVAGSLVFALMPSFATGLISLFAIGVGVTALQIVGNLLVKKIDSDPNKYSRNLTMAQVFCGLGGFSGGFIIAYLKSAGFNWSTAYFVAAGLGTVLALFALFTFIPEDNSSEENAVKPTMAQYLSLAKHPVMLMFAAGIFIYVGVEVGVANWISTFLVDVHKMPATDAAKIVSLFWALQSVGRFSGGVVLNYLSAAKALILYAFGCLLSLIVAIYAPSVAISSTAFIAVGFFTSIMFPSIFSLAVNSFDKKLESTVAGVLCTAIIGGAVTQLVIGWLSSVFASLSTSLVVTGAISFLYIAFIGIRALNASNQASANKESNEYSKQKVTA
jgi:MFS transporter, FHS family, L-fucose permease